MINSHQPKFNFQSYHKLESEELGKQVAQRWFQLSLDTAMAQLAANGVNADELLGARRFVAILVNLSEKDVAPQSMPINKLDQPEP